MQHYAAVSVLVALLTWLGYRFMGNRDRGQFLISFAAIFLLAWLSRSLTNIPFIKSTGFESVFFAVIIGLLIRNTIGLPKWLAPAARSEYYIKAGLVILGSSIFFQQIMVAGSLGMVQAVIVVLSVWYFSFWWQHVSFASIRRCLFSQVLFPFVASRQQWRPAVL